MTYFLLVISIGAVWVSGYMIGVARTKHLLSMNIVDDPDRIIEIIQEIKRKNAEFEEDSNATEVVIEQHNDRFFVYNKSTNLFLGQGSSVDEAMDVVVQRFPTQVFVYDED